MNHGEHTEGVIQWDITYSLTVACLAKKKKIRTPKKNSGRNQQNEVTCMAITHSGQLDPYIPQ